MRAIINTIAIRRVGSIAVVAICWTQFIGCNANDTQVRVAPVVGKIFYKGRPLSQGKIVMIHDSGKAGASEIQSDGTYRLEALVGENRVMVDSRDQVKLSQGGPRQAQLMPSIIPKRYLDYMSSGLKLTVSDGENMHDFHLSE